MKLQKKTAIVTGGGSGVGRAICKTLATNGMNIVALDLNLNRTTAHPFKLSNSSWHDVLLEGDTGKAILKIDGNAQLSVDGNALGELGIQNLSTIKLHNPSSTDSVYIDNLEYTVKK